MFVERCCMHHTKTKSSFFNRKNKTFHRGVCASVLRILISIHALLINKATFQLWLLLSRISLISAPGLAYELLKNISKIFVNKFLFLASPYLVGLIRYKVIQSLLFYCTKLKRCEGDQVSYVDLLN